MNTGALFRLASKKLRYTEYSERVRDDDHEVEQKGKQEQIGGAAASELPARGRGAAAPPTRRWSARVVLRHDAGPPAYG